ncbi:hypothetical protein GCM10010424_72650 [Streptomyces lienomycini]
MTSPRRWQAEGLVHPHQQERIGQTMRAAELGDAGGPPLVAPVAATVSLGWGYAGFAPLTALLLPVVAVPWPTEVSVRPSCRCSTWYRA